MERPVFPLLMVFLLLLQSEAVLAIFPPVETGVYLAAGSGVTSEYRHSYHSRPVYFTEIGGSEDGQYGFLGMGNTYRKGLGVFPYKLDFGFLAGLSNQIKGFAGVNTLMTIPFYGWDSRLLLSHSFGEGLNGNIRISRVLFRTRPRNSVLTGVQFGMEHKSITDELSPQPRLVLGVTFR